MLGAPLPNYRRQAPSRARDALPPNPAPGGDRNFFNITQQSYDGMMQGLYGTIVFIQEVSRHMIERGGGGRIVSVSSSSAFRPHAQDRKSVV